MPFPHLDVDPPVPDGAFLLQSWGKKGLPLDGDRRGGIGVRKRLLEDLAERANGGGGAGMRIEADFLDLLGDGRDAGWSVRRGGSGLALGREPEGEEEEQEHEGGAEADTDDDPHMEAEDGGALG